MPPSPDIYLATGSAWRDELRWPGDGHAVRGYGDGDPPILDGTDVATGWTPTPGHPNVYQVDWPHTVPGGNTPSLLRVWEDGHGMDHVDRLSDLPARPGRCFVTEARQNPATVYVHPTGSGDPAARRYEITRRPFAVDVGGGAIDRVGTVVEGLHTRRSAHNDGSIRVGLDATIRRCLIEDGGKHNFLIGSGLVEDVIALGVTPYLGRLFTSMGVAFFDQRRVSGPQDYTLRRVMVLGGTPGRLLHASGFYSHAQGGSFRHALIEGYVAQDVATALNPAADRITIRGLVARNTKYVGYKADQGGSMRYAMVEKTHSDGWQSVQMNAQDCFYRGRELFNGTDPDLVLRTTTFVVTGNYRVMYCYGPEARIRSWRCVYFGGREGWAKRGHIALGTSSTDYAGDYNVFWTFDPTTEIDCSYGGRPYRRLADWQAATGHDAHSVYLTDAQAATFFLGDPRDGDARINPAAEVTAADGTVYTGTFPDGTPITTAGPQAHWDFNRHAPAPGPPTRWPVAPRTLDDAKRYVRAPRAWDFYPPRP